jgi:hypothetical protein
MHNKDKKMSNILQSNSIPSADGLAQNPMLNAVAVSEGEICKALNSYFIGNCRYKLSNAFIFKDDWESDFFVQKQNGYSYEFEVKISRSDFFADKKKVNKHSILENGFYKKIHKTGIYNLTAQRTIWEEKSENKEVKFKPNKFFYVVPTDLVTVDELPKYAGLFYYKPYTGNCGLTKIKDAPFIHKEALKFESVLCSKFYNYWLNAKIEIRQLKQKLESMKYGSNGI